MTLKLAPLLNAEVLRAAKAENKTDEDSMTEFMDELAALCEVGTRQVYRWRSGSAPLPAEHVATLCTRFGSNALLDEMTRTATAIEVPDEFDLARVATRSVREDMTFIEEILTDFESDGIQPGERDRLRQLAARAHANIHHLMEIAEADCARRQTAPPRKGSAKSEVRGQKSEARKTGTL